VLLFLFEEFKMGLHKDVAESNMHEPKGMTTLTAGAGDIGKVTVSKGDGTTEARKLSRTEMSDTFEHYGQLTVSNNATVISMTAAVDSTLATNTDYIKVTGIYDAIPHGEQNGITQQADTLTIAQTGVYHIAVWTDVASSLNSTTVAFKFAVNTVIALVRRPKNFVRNAGEFHNLSAHGIVMLTAGDIVDLRIASDLTADITLEDLVFTIDLLRAV